MSKRRRIILSLVFGSALYLAIQAHSAGVNWLGRYTEYLEVTIISDSDTLADWVSFDGNGRIVWCDHPDPGFYKLDRMVAYFDKKYGHSAWTILMFELAKLLLTSGWFYAMAGILLRARTKTQFTIAGVPIDEKKSCYHTLITGCPGSGKSTAIKDILDQARQRGRRAIVYDIGGEYIEHFYREGRDILLNPFDARTALWTPWAEVRRRSDYGMMARSLFPSGGKDPFWADAAQQCFASLIEALAKNGCATNRRLNKLLRAGDSEKLFNLLHDTPASRFLDPKGDTLASNVLATVMAKLGIWSVLDDPNDSEQAFSIRDFVTTDDDRWLFLSAREDSAQLTKPLLSLWCDLAATEILSLPADQQRSLFLVLDEVAALQRLPALPGLLERGRKHGVSVVLGLQAMPQLREAYGIDGAQALVAQPQTWLVLRSVDPDTAHWLESALGSAEVVSTATSVSMREVGRDGYSIQERHERRPLALASEIQLLQDCEGYLRLPGKDAVYRVAFSSKARTRIARPFVEKIAEEVA
jgi:hypothetical protein